MQISSPHAGPAQLLPPGQPIEVEAAMSQQGISRVIHEAFEAWNAHDVDRYVALLDEGYMEETHTVPVPVCGREAARAAMQEYLRVLPDLHFDLDVVVGSGDQVFARWQVTGTYVGELTSVTASDRRLEDYGCTLSRLKQGKILHVWHYWETDRVPRHVAPH